MSSARNDGPIGLRLSREAFREWVEAQSRGRYERDDGCIVAMAPERRSHARRKAAVWLALTRAVSAARLRCEVYPDGLTVGIGDSDYEPDAIMRCGATLPDDGIDIPDPLLVVEVLSPGTRHIELTKKLVDYFQIPTLHHYLIVYADRPQAIHHQRLAGGEGISTRIVTTGDIRLDPPGMTITLEDIYAG